MRKAHWRIARMIFISALLVVLAPQSLPGPRAVAAPTDVAWRHVSPAHAIACISRCPPANTSTTVLAEIDDDNDDNDDDERCDESSFLHTDQDRNVAAVVHRILGNSVPRAPFRLAAIRGRAPPAV